MSRSTVVNILRGANIDPGPSPGEGPRSDFIRRYAATLWAADFVTVRALAAGGLVDLNVLLFLRVGTRKVIASAPTATPGAAWVAQQARNASMQAAEWDLGTTHLIIDRDSEFTDSFGAAFVVEGAKVVRVGPAAPTLNSFAERGRCATNVRSIP